MGPKTNTNDAVVVKSIKSIDVKAAAVKETKKARIAREEREKEEREQQLRGACEDGQINRVMELLDEGVDINAKNNTG